MSSLDTLKKSNSLDKLLAAAESENAPVEKQSYVDERMWKPELDKSGNGYAVIVFYQHPMVKICLGPNFGITHFKDQLVSGILKTH